jgi:ribonuclease J
MVCDSTNAFTDKASGSEAELFDGLRSGCGAKRPGGCWSPPSPPTPRGCTPSAGGGGDRDDGSRSPGRSIERYLKVARATGYLNDFPETVRYDEAMRLPRRELLWSRPAGRASPRAALGPDRAGQHEIKFGRDGTR